MRVSTNKQSVEMQRKALLKHIATTGDTLYAEYIDVGISGKKQDRVGLNSLMVDARARKFDKVMVWKFDRFARSVVHLIQSLEEFSYLNIAFESITNQFDSNNPVGKAMFTIIAMFAELENDIRSERIKAGMQVAKHKGIKIGRPGVPLEVSESVRLYASFTTDSISTIYNHVDKKMSRATVGRIVKQQRELNAKAKLDGN